MRLSTFRRGSACVPGTVQGGPGDHADRDSEYKRSGQVPAAELPQAVQQVAQSVIADIRCGSIQSIRCPGSEVADGRGTLVP